MNFLAAIESKRDGKPLSAHQIAEFVAGVTSSQIPDYQLSAFLMAVFFQGLTTEETTALTLAMRDSGDKLQFPQDSRPLVDKHSTGGVGDKVSLPLAPLLACLGFRVPMISGRGLGITGGTLDKLDSIPGFQTSLSADRIVQIVQEVGCVICGQTDRMVPADKRLYALRDVTGTVPSIPLIVASILSKKLAESLQALVLDVKFGAAAFMKTRDQARELATAMVKLGTECGVNTRALITSMDAPLGCAAGNWLEVKESVACLENRGPQDLKELVLACASHLIVQSGKATSLAEAKAKAEQCLASGAPRQKWNDMLSAQGADLIAFERKFGEDSIAPVTADLLADHSGTVCRCDAGIIGEVVRDLGGGRVTKESKIDYSVGVDFIARLGTEVNKGDVLARIHASDNIRAESARTALQSAFGFGRVTGRFQLIAETVG